MRRRLIIPLLVYVGGLVSALCTALLAVYLLPIHAKRPSWLDIPSYMSHATMFDWVEPFAVDTWERPYYSFSTLDFLGVDYAYAFYRKDSDLGSVVRVSAGLPLRCLEGFSYNQGDDRGPINVDLIEIPRPWPNELPMRIRPSALLINGAVHAMLWWLVLLLLVRAPPGLRGAIRIWRGCCARCGYPHGPSGTCPECGHPHRPKPSPA